MVMGDSPSTKKCLRLWVKVDQAVRPLPLKPLNILVGLTLKLDSLCIMLKTSGRFGLFLEYFVLLAWKGLFWLVDAARDFYHDLLLVQLCSLEMNLNENNKLRFL